MKKLDLYIEHATILVYDSREPHPENHWTLRHYNQGFARRATTVSVRTIFEEDGMVVELSESAGDLKDCSHLLQTSLRCDSGSVMLSGTDPVGMPVWTGSSGWLRVSIGQQLLQNDDMAEERLVLVFEPIDDELPSRQLVDGQEVSDLLEIADPESPAAR